MENEPPVKIEPPVLLEPTVLNEPVKKGIPPLMWGRLQEGVSESSGLNKESNIIECS